MELGFAVASGPLSQISVSLFSVELAVQLATGAYGWWKARDRSQSLVSLVGSKGAQISATSTFNLLRYMDKRKDSLTRGIARGPDGVLSCVTLPNASTASAGDAGMICLRAVVCGLLCFYNAPTVLAILVNALPGTLYTSDQDGGDVTIEGPLHSCLREYIKAVEIEEDSDELRQKLQDLVDSKLSNITGATRIDVFDCDEFLESDAPNFMGVLRWILTPVLHRKEQVYPTRSLKVWAFGVIMAQLGFEVSASMQAISSKEDYETYVERVGYQSTYQEVILVTSNVGLTDPFSFGVHKTSTSPKPRIGSIRSIPWIAFRHLSDSQSPANTSHLSEIWEFTFDYVLNLLRPPPRDDYREIGIQYTDAGFASFEDATFYQPSNSELRNKLQWLTFTIMKPLQKFLPSGSDNDSIWAWTNTVGQLRGETAEYLEVSQSDADGWYITRTVVLATIYAICAKWLHPDDNSSLLDTEVAYSPDFIRRGNLAAWTSFRCFSSVMFSDRLPTKLDARWGYRATMDHSEWLHLLYMVFSGTHKDSSMESRIPGYKEDFHNRTILGFQKNGVVLVPELLLNPSPYQESWFRFRLRVGQLLDLPLDEDGFICHARKPKHTKYSDTWVYGLTGQLTPHVDRHQPSDTLVRLDAEPWWEFDERVVVFRARVGGIVRAIINPEDLYRRKYLMLRSQCTCSTPKDSVTLEEPVMVIQVSDLLQNQSKDMIYDPALPYGGKKMIIVPTGGDPIVQALCVALVSALDKRGYVVVECLDAINLKSFHEIIIL